MKRSIIANVIIGALFLWPAIGTAQDISDCPSTTLTVCGQNVVVPFLYFGAQATLKVPSPYQHQLFTAVCANSGGSSQLQFPGFSSITCSLLTCPASQVQVCGKSIPVAGGTLIGKTIDAPVPASLTISTIGENPSFTVHCVDDGQGGAAYEAENPSNLSCNVFPCESANVALCGTSIPVEGGAALGDVLHLTMPPPFAPDPFSVQCVGSAGDAPIYQISDLSGVTCSRTSP